MSTSHTAGTASRGYRMEPDPHRFEGEPRGEWGERPRCRLYGDERSVAAHTPVVRAA